MRRSYHDHAQTNLASTDLGRVTKQEDWYTDNRWVFGLDHKWKPTVKNCPVTKVELAAMYVVERMNMRQIAEELGVNKMNIANWMKAFDIPRRPAGRGSK